MGRSVEEQPTNVHEMHCHRVINVGMIRIRKPSIVAGRGSHGRYRTKRGYAMADITMKQAKAVLDAALSKAEEIDDI